MNIIWKGSPNFTEGREGKKVNKFVIHWFGVGTIDSADKRFQNATNKVSAHYGIADNTVYQWVDTDNTAYHAGNWEVNTESIGIEHDCTTIKKMTEATYETSSSLIAELSVKYDIPLDINHVVGHKTITATQCPGTIDIGKLISMAKAKIDPCKECREKAESLDKELDEMRASRDKWKADYKALEKVYEKEVADLIIHRDLLQKDLSEANAQIETLKKAIQTNKTPLSAYTVKERFDSIVKSLFIGGDL